jgi:hypothetical protein
MLNLNISVPYQVASFNHCIYRGISLYICHSSSKSFHLEETEDGVGKKSSDDDSDDDDDYLSDRSLRGKRENQPFDAIIFV